MWGIIYGWVMSITPIQKREDNRRGSLDVLEERQKSARHEKEED
tara:strand:+ start:741 stop:872 length:132 start_codon:yes stop_codon:yes gene_type:complete